MPRVLITGATGFIGGHLVHRNLARGHRVRALVLPDDPERDALAGCGVEVIAGDIRDPLAVQQATRDVDVVFHCAAVVTDWAEPRLFDDVTVGGTKNVCRAAAEARVRRLVHLSTNDVFGRDESRILDETCPWTPWGEPYPDAKIAAERVVWRAHRELGLPVALAYPCWVYGPGDRTFVPLLADAIVKRELVFWRRYALVWPTFVDNLVDLLLVLGDDDRAVGNGYLVHDGEVTTLEAFSGRLAEALGTPSPGLHLPYGLVYAAAVLLEAAGRAVGRKERPLLTTYVVKNLGSRLRFSIAKAERELGWRPRVSYAEGFATTIAWLKGLDHAALKRH